MKKHEPIILDREKLDIFSSGHIGDPLIDDIKKFVRERGYIFGRELDEFLELTSNVYNGKGENKRIGLRNLKGKKVEDITIN